MVAPGQCQHEAYLPGMAPTMPTRLLVSIALLVPGRAAAQVWRPGSEIALIERAVAVRTARDLDTRLGAWGATAHGILRFSSLISHDGIPVERVIRADELRDEVYGEAPNRSKQIIAAWRDTTFLPNHLVYHRDHLGIVANDFGTAIRLGQGDEVRDVPHPLSTAGLALYRFAVGDTVTITGPAGPVRVVGVRERPVDPSMPGTVGTLYLDVDRAALVRFEFTFTPSSYRDRTVDDITVTLENALQRNTLWLPWRQSIVIRRGEPLLDLPIRTVIRADWTINDYRFGVTPPAPLVIGTSIAGRLQPPAGGGWSGSIAARLDALPATEAEVDAVRRVATRELEGRVLSGLGRWRFAGTGVSGLLHVNRVQGVTPTPGFEFAIGRGWSLHARGGIGLSDHRAVGGLELRRTAGGLTWSVAAQRDVVDIGDRRVISGISNSVGTLLGGGDFGDYTLVERAMAGVGGAAAGTAWSFELGHEWSRSVTTEFTPISGEAAPNPALGAGGAGVIRAAVWRPRESGLSWRVDAEAATGDTAWTRIDVRASERAAISLGHLDLTAELGAGSRRLPGYRSFALGGRGTLPGVPFRAVGGRRIALAQVAWELPVPIPTPPVPASRYAPLPSTLSPFIAGGIAGGSVAGTPWLGTRRIEPVAGLRLDLWGPMLRIETGISLRTGHADLIVDVHPDWWPLM
ncbi:MAG: hypothetical protein ACREL5_02595 [Gemmatimonadales bacterium]